MLDDAVVTDEADARAALQRIAAFHVSELRDGQFVCGHCGFRWPCPTYEVVEPFIGDFRRQQGDEFMVSVLCSHGEKVLLAAGRPTARVEARTRLARRLGAAAEDLPRHASRIDQAIVDAYLA